MPNILITGVTGNVGTELTKQLSAQNVPFRALVRSSKRADGLAALAGAEIVVGDLSDSRSISDALKDVERAFLLTNSSEQAEQLQCASTALILASLAAAKNFPCPTIVSRKASNLSRL